jgi:hypothetical protein
LIASLASLAPLQFFAQKGPETARKQACNPAGLRPVIKTQNGLEKTSQNPTLQWSLTYELKVRIFRQSIFHGRLIDGSSVIDQLQSKFRETALFMWSCLSDKLQDQNEHSVQFWMSFNENVQ